MLGNDAREHVGARADYELDRVLREVAVLHRRVAELRRRQRNGEPDRQSETFAGWMTIHIGLFKLPRAKKGSGQWRVSQGRSGVLFDSAAPNVNPGAISRGTCMTDLWVYDSLPANVRGSRDDGNLPFHFEPPP